MADGGQAPEQVTNLDKTPPPQENADKSAVTKLLDEVYADLGKLGIGPKSVLKETYSKPPDNNCGLPEVTIWDPGKLPDVQVADAKSDQPATLPLPVKLEPPGVHFDGDGYTVKVSPTGNPLKKEGGVQVSGTFN